MSEEQSLRLLWGPLIGNGIALITLGGLIGNVPSPDLALKSLSIPLAHFSVGVLSGAACAWVQSTVQTAFSRVAEFRSVTEDLDRRRVGLSSKLHELRWKEPPFLVRDISQRFFEIAALEHEADDAKARSARLERDLTHAEAMTSAPRRMLANLLLNISLAAFAGGMVWIAVSLFDGSIHLERPPVSPAAAASIDRNAGALAQVAASPIKPKLAKSAHTTQAKPQPPLSHPDPQPNPKVRLAKPTSAAADGAAP